MSDILCVGGPENGNRLPDYGNVAYVRLPDPHHFLNVQPEVKPCLELREIEALTGSDCHRHPRGHILAEHHERQIALTRHYLKRRFTDGREVFDVYVFNGIPDDVALKMFTALTATPQGIVAEKSKSH